MRNHSGLPTGFWPPTVQCWQFALTMGRRLIMAISGLVNLLESPAIQQLGPAHSTARLNSEQSARAQNQDSAAPAPNTTDRYTPSDRNDSTQIAAQAAGLFQIAPFLQFTAPGLASAQAVAPQSVQNVTPAQTPTAPNPASAAVAVAHANTVTTPAPATSAINTASASQEVELQALNTALSNLGLDSAQISRVDQIASSVIQNFSPTAYSDIVYQRQSLTQQSTQETALSAIGAPNTGTSRGAS